MRDRRVDPDDDRGGSGGRRDRYGDDITDAAGRFMEGAVDGLGKIFGGGGRRGGRSASPVDSLCNAIDREREALEMLGIISAEDYDSWINKLEKAHSTLSSRARDADMSYALESFIQELKTERADFNR